MTISTTLAAFATHFWIIPFMKTLFLLVNSGALWKTTFLPFGISCRYLKRLQQDMTCTTVPWLPADTPKAARLINDIVIGEETDVDPDGLFVSHLELYLRAMEDVGASTVQFDTFCAMVRAGDPVEVALTRVGVARHVRAFVTNTMTLANAGTTEEVLGAFFYGREDIIPEMFRRLLDFLRRELRTP